MADTAISSRAGRANGVAHIFEWSDEAAMTTGIKAKFIVPFFCRIKDVIIDMATAGSGAGDTIFDVHLNGTTIYTTQANRPQLDTADTGMAAEANEPEITALRPGDVLELECDAIPATTGHAKVAASIVVGYPN
jgi:hypothetical protein